ncbi:MAG: carboxypeptidase-like regulatory domain-containing protein [Bacteroidetes bacterium]|nr:carboxypeptidase-like regulatory domain-containing protein [Bacteroidota bacterium]
MKRLIILFSVFCIIINCSVSGQAKIISGVIKDSHSEEPVPFASILFKNTKIGKLSDSAGSFTFHFDKLPSDTLLVTCVGYQPLLYVIHKFKDSLLANILMERGTFNEDVVIRIKVNKGLLLWRKIIKHKDRNDRYRYQNFSYELYNKLELDIKNLNFDKLSKFKPLRPVGNLIRSNVDTSEGLQYLPTYLTEVLSDYYYQKKPEKFREVIKAANTNGVKNESIVKLLGGMEQNIDVYKNFIPVFDKQFISPISNNGDYYYNYRVTDTQFFNHHKFYHLVFTPRRKGENTFEGDCWVNDSTFAIQKMNLRLGKEANVNFLDKLSLIQEYSLINDSTWFLSKDKFVADISPLGKGKPGFIGRKTTTYKNIILNDSSVIKELSHNKIKEEVVTLPGAGEKSKDFWSSSRHEELSNSEKAIIKMIDTLTNAPVFKRFTKTISFIGTGYLDVGNYQFGPWYNFFTYNGWEGYRMRFDIGTNHHFDKHIWWHGYLAYGFGDRKLKGKAELFYLPKKHPRLYLYGSYTNDLDFGQNYYGEVTSDNIFALAIRKPHVPIKYMNVVEKRFEFFNEQRSGLSTLLAVTHKKFNPLQNIPPKDSFALNNGREALSTFETSLKIRFAYLEKFLENEFFRTSLGSPYPIGELYLSKGFAGVAKSGYNYFKISGSISDYIKIPPYGSFSFNIYAGRTFGTLPYVLLDIAPGNELYYYNTYAFNTMNRYEYIHDKYAGLNLDYNIGNGIFRFINFTRKMKIRQFFTAKTLWGSLSDANRNLNFKQGSTFQSLNGKTYLEIGTGVDNILRVFRLDFVWRLLPRPLPSINSERFGIFGSFRISF